MKSMTILVAILIAVSSAFCNDTVKDPILDFLQLPIEERYTDASSVVRVHEIRVDIDGDGVDELFVGHHMMWWGDNYGLYGAFYKKSPQGYVRLTPKDKAIAIDPRFFGRRDSTFCGFINEINGEGLLVLANDFVSRDPEDSEKLVPPDSYSSRRIFRVVQDRLEVIELGPLDLHSKEGKAFYDEYFGGQPTRSVRADRSYSVDELKEKGYEIPDWKRPPQMPGEQIAPTTRPVAPLQQTNPLKPPVEQTWLESIIKYIGDLIQNSSFAPVMLIMVISLAAFMIITRNLRR
jgi:hypothetical protein